MLVDFGRSAGMESVGVGAKRDGRDERSGLGQVEDLLDAPAQHH